MTLSVPSFLASATSASIPPPAAASVAVAHALPPGCAPAEPAPPPPPPLLLTQPAVVRASSAPTAAATTRRVDVLVIWSPRAACDGVQRDRPRRTGRVDRPSPQCSAGVRQSAITRRSRTRSPATALFCRWVLPSSADDRGGVPWTC